MSVLLYKIKIRALHIINIWRNFDLELEFVGTHDCCRKWSEDGSCFCACGCVHVVGFEVKRLCNFSDSVVKKGCKKL